VVKQGGSVAVKNGKWYESEIKDALIRVGFTELSVSEKQILKEDNQSFKGNDPWFVQQIKIAENVYGVVGVSDFYIYHPDKFPDGCIIESKWQGSQGSVDEKYVFTVESLKIAKCKTMLVLSGSGARKPAITWMRKESDLSVDNQFTFLYRDEFMEWARDTLQ